MKKCPNTFALESESGLNIYVIIVHLDFDSYFMYVLELDIYT